MQSHRGFSLVELLVVVVVIALVAAIAIPNLLASRRAANEGSTVASLRTLHGANFTYASTIGNGSYAGLDGTVGVSSLTELGNAALIDPVLQSGEKSGYSYVGDRALATPAESESFYFAANPSTPMGVVMTGTKRFGVATDGVIRSDADPINIGVPFDAVTLAAATSVGNN
jgi:type IV pilus assembly protein PilA